MVIWIALLAVFIGLAAVLKARQLSSPASGRSSGDAIVHVDGTDTTSREHDQGDSGDGGDSGDAGGGDGS